MLTVASSVEVAVRAVKAGAYDFLAKPVDPARLMVAVRAALTLGDERRRRRELEATLNQVARQSLFPEILSCSAAMQKVFNLMEAALDHQLAVLIQGESGTGKELVAQAIHAKGRRRKGPFVVLNAAALPENLVEGQLFGHERGAFTGADQARPGLVEAADKGTLFLDEIGDMPLSIQPKFLRCLQDGKVQRLGSAHIRSVDFRLVAATNRSLAEGVREGRFREDLYYRIAVFPIQLPPLRERREDILPLMRHFFALAGRPRMWIDPKAEELLEAHPWPGNVRELQNLTARIAVMLKKDHLTLEEIQAQLRSSARPHLAATPISNVSLYIPTPVPSAQPANAGAPEPTLNSPGSISTPANAASSAQSSSSATIAPSSEPLDEIIPLADLEHQAIENALRICNGNVAAAARALGIGRTTLFRHLRSHGIRRPSGS
jgi:DNA-binding NtrC family response regulator